MEPKRLTRGKLFHQLVQTDWKGLLEGALVASEHSIELIPIKQSIPARKGRIDIFVHQIEDFVSVFEIKSTNWDKIKKTNRKKSLDSHRRQILRYIDKYLAANNVNVCAAIIYPKEPADVAVKEEIEKYFGDYGLDVMWYK